MIDFSKENYEAGAMEKVFRLLDLLSEIDRHPVLLKNVCLYGGTAINLFLLDAPRLSIDADIAYIGSADKLIAEKERPAIESAIKDVGSFLGYNVTATKGMVAGRTFRLRYMGNRGGDFIKIDANFLNRQPLLPPVRSRCKLDDSVHVRTFSKDELIAGKTKALFDRVAPRDIYDISQLYGIINKLIDPKDDTAKQKLRRIIIFYAALSNLFPTEFSGLTEKRFAGREQQIRDELYPVLRINNRPGLDDLIRVAEAFVSEYVTPKDKMEKEYLEHFAKGEYKPELLFGDWPDILLAAQNSPSAKWKLLNLNKRDMKDQA